MNPRCWRWSAPLFPHRPSHCLLEALRHSGLPQTWHQVGDFCLQSVGLVLWGSSLLLPCSSCISSLPGPWFPSQEGDLVAVGHCLCSNVSLGLSQACLCSSSLTLVSLTVLRHVSFLTNVRKLLPNG